MGASASAENLSIRVCSSGAKAAQVLVDLWKQSHYDQIAITVIPDNPMVTKLVTGVQADDAPDQVSFDVIFMPDFKHTGRLVTVDWGALQAAVPCTLLMQDSSVVNGADKDN